MVAGLSLQGQAPTPVGFYPPQNSANQQQQPEIWVELTGDVDPDLSALKLNDEELSPVTTEPVGDNTRIRHALTTPLAAGSVNDVEVTFGAVGEEPVTQTWRFTVGAVTTISAAYREPGDPADVGFVARIHLADAVNAAGNPAGLPNTTQRAENQVRGFLVNPHTGEFYENAASLSSTIIEGYINMNVNANVTDPAEANQNGNFVRANGYQDMGYPGLPGTVSGAESRRVENFAIEFVAYLDLPAGPITFGVNSDDGFIVKTAPNPYDINAMALGVFEGGRGSSDTHFNVFIEEAGLYPIRLLQYQGGGGGDVEFFSILPNGTRVLINDVVIDSAVPAYQTVSSVEPSLTIERLLPAPNSVRNPKTSAIVVWLSDADGAVLDPESIALEVNGEDVEPTIDGFNGVTTIVYQPAEDLPLGATIACSLTFTDSNEAAYEVEWAFEVSGEIRMRIFGGSNLVPPDPITGGTVAHLTGSAQFRENRPAVNQIVPVFEINPWNRADNYGSEFLGYFVPKTTDYYTFYLSSDDASQLWLSTDASPVNASIIASQSGWNGRLAWTTGIDAAARKSAEIHLEAGQEYFIRTLHKEGGGGDNLEVTFRTQSNPAIANGDPAMSAELRPYDGFVVSPLPVGGTVLQTRSWTFNGGYVAGPSGAITYQWFKDGEEIEGAIQPSYTIASAALDDAGDYALEVTMAGEPPLTATSPVVTLDVEPDNDPPVLISGAFLASNGTVGLLFNEPVDIADAEFIVEGAEVTSSEVLATLPTIVRLNITGTPEIGFQITVNQVRDLAGNPLTVTITGEVSDMQSQDIIRARDAEGNVTDPLLPGNALALGDGAFYVAGGGSDIWDNADGFHYLYKQWTGAFDMQVNIASFSGTHQWAKANVMARETLEGGSRHVNAMATRSDGNGQNNFGIQWRNTTGGGSGGVNPVNIRDNANYPNAWLRLVREDATANVFKAYWSNNGTTWNQLPSHEIPTTGGVLPETLYVGMGVTSHDNSATAPLARAVYRSFSLETPPPAITVQPQASVVTLPGRTVTLSVTAIGDEPITYQWTKDSVDIDDATEATLVLADVQADDAGTYAVRVTGPGGTTTSNNSVVEVLTSTLNLWEILETTPELSTLKSAAESVGLDGALRGTDMLTVFAPTDAAFAALPEGLLEELTAQELAGLLTYHAIPGQNLAGDLVAGRYQTLLGGFSVTVSWQNATLRVDDATVIAPNVVAVNGVAHLIDAVLLEPATLEPPVITAQPLAAVTADPGDTVTLSVVATSTQDMTYQWTRNGDDIDGATQATLVLSDVQPENAGTYAVKVSNPAGTVVSNDSVVTVTDPVPPETYNIAWVSFHPADDQPSTAAADAGFTEAPDVGYTELLRSAGHNVTRIVTSNNPDAGLLNRFDLIIISRSAPSGDYQNVGATRWNAIETPMIVINGYIMRANRMGYTTGDTIPDTDRPVSLRVLDAAHPVFAGIQLDVENTMVNPYAGIVTFNDIVQRGVSVNHAPIAGGGTVLAVIGTEGDPAFDGLVIGEWQAGATMGNAAGDVLGGHRLAILTGSREQGFTSHGAGIYDLTEDGARMFLNAVDYMAVAKTILAQPVIADGFIMITWTGPGELYTADDINGPWEPTGNTSGEAVEEIGDGNKFYQVRPHQPE
jgi:uncharacterized surface protein with fasciclin (FAS1) repeats